MTAGTGRFVPWLPAGARQAYWAASGPGMDTSPYAAAPHSGCVPRPQERLKMQTAPGPTYASFCSIHTQQFSL